MSDNLNWSGIATDVIPFGTQNLTVGFSTNPEDPIGTVTIKGIGSVVLLLPNSTKSSPTWDDIPGTSPVLQARQDGHFPNTSILIRYKDGTTAALSGTVTEANTVFINRPTLADPPSAADVWQFRYNGVRTLYANEYNLLRVRGVPDDQAPARFMSNAARDGLVTPILQVSLANATSHLFQVLGNGDILGPGAASMLPTAPVAVTYNAGIGTPALISDGSANTGAPYPVTSTYHAADNRVYLDGSFSNTTGASIPGGTLLFTIATAHRPAAWVQFNERTSTTLSARVTIRGNTGQVFIDQALAAGATCSVDGLNYRKA